MKYLWLIGDEEKEEKKPLERTDLEIGWTVTTVLFRFVLWLMQSRLASFLAEITAFHVTYQ